MATKKILVSDLSGSEEDVETITFAFRGTVYSIDLTSDEVQELSDLLDPYIDAAGATAASASATSGSPDPAAVRAWALDEGYEVAPKGRVPFEIVRLYTEAHS